MNLKETKYSFEKRRAETRIRLAFHELTFGIRTKPTVTMQQRMAWYRMRTASRAHHLSQYDLADEYLFTTIPTDNFPRPWTAKDTPHMGWTVTSKPNGKAIGYNLAQDEAIHLVRSSVLGD